MTVDAEPAWEAYAQRPFGIVLLDLGLPGGSGLELCRRMRQHPHGAEAVLVIITGDRDPLTLQATLDAGADDYLVKPFDLDELAARVRAVARRHAGHAAAQIRIGELEIDTATRRVRWKGREAALSAREYAVLEALAQRPGALLSRSQLEDRLYGWDEEIASNAVEVHVHALRRKLDAALIKTVRGMGYMIEAGP